MGRRISLLRTFLLNSLVGLLFPLPAGVPILMNMWSGKIQVSTLGLVLAHLGWLFIGVVYGALWTWYYYKQSKRIGEEELLEDYFWGQAGH